MIGARLGAGREADVHAWGTDAVVKLYRPGFLGHRAEAMALTRLDGHGVAPKLIDAVDGRSAFAGGYTRAYRRGSRRPSSRPDPWLLVHAAARLGEGIEVERATLIGWLDRAVHGPR